MKSQPLISIITPTYNHEKFIEKCIKSVIGQEYTNWELIIINDGSTDKTEEIVLRHNDKRIIYLKQENLGIWNLKNTYNKALQVSNGELIAVLEGDDLWPPDKLKIQANVFKNPNIVLSWGKARVIDEKGNLFGKIPPIKNIESLNTKTEGFNLKKLLFDNFIPACTVICRKSALDAIGGFKQPEHTPYVDYPTWLWLSLEGQFFAIDNVLGYWRKHKNQISTKKIMDMVKAENYVIEFAKNLPDKKKKALNIDLDEIILNNKQRLAAAYCYLGRKDLFSKKWSESKDKFKLSLIDGSYKTKTKSLFGLILAYLFGFIN